MARMHGVADQVKEFWTTRNGRQRIMLLGGGAVTVLLIAGFVWLLGAPDYKPLFTGMEPSDAQKLASQLDSQNIPHQISPDGKTVSVPSDKLDAARLQSAAQGEPHSGRMGFELFDKVSWGETEFDQKVAYQRAMEGELERSIQTLAEVEKARVHLVMATDSVFLDRQRPGKASVILKLRRGGLSKDAVAAISRLVSGAVDGLKPEDVVIVDADSNRSVGLQSSGSETGEAEEARLTDRLLNTLEPLVGANSIRASVNITYDQGSSEKSSEEYDPSVSAVLASQKTEDANAGAAVAAGVPGTASNVPSTDKSKPASVAMNVPSSQTSKTENVQYGVDHTVTRTVTPAGRIQRITAAILLDDPLIKTEHGGKSTYVRKPRSAEEMTKVREIAQAAIGFDPARGDAITVEEMPFNANTPENDLVAPTVVTQVQKALNTYSSIVRPASLLVLFMIVYLLILRPVQKQVLSPAPSPANMQPALAGSGQQALTLPNAMEQSARAAQLKQQALDLVRQKPVDTARALRVWVKEDE